MVRIYYDEYEYKYGESFKESDKEWESSNEKHTECPYKRRAVILIPYEVYYKIRELVREIETEWLAYLPYEIIDDCIFKVTDIIIPEQEVTSTSVDVIDSRIGVGKGVIHCHPWKGKTSFSGTDDKWINSNHPFSVLVNKELDFSAKAILELPCGIKLEVDAPVEIEYPIVDTEEFMEKAKGLIKHRTVKYAYEYKKERKRRKSKSYELEYFRCPYCASTFIEYIDDQAYCAMCGKVIPEELLW